MRDYLSVEQGFPKLVPLNLLDLGYSDGIVSTSSVMKTELRVPLPVPSPESALAKCTRESCTARMNPQDSRTHSCGTRRSIVGLPCLPEMRSSSISVLRSPSWYLGSSIVVKRG